MEDYQATGELIRKEVGGPQSLPILIFSFWPWSRWFCSAHTPTMMHHPKSKVSWQWWKLRKQQARWVLGARLSGYQKRTDTAIILLLSHGREIWPLWLELGSSDFKAFASKWNSAGPGLVPIEPSLSKLASVSSRSPGLVMQSLCAEGVLANVVSEPQSPHLWLSDMLVLWYLFNCVCQSAHTTILPLI